MGEAAATSIEIDGGGGGAAAVGMGVDKDPSLAGWESLLPRTVLRVLLVEGDDSTRHIIAALLRICSYRGRYMNLRRVDWSNELWLMGGLRRIDPSHASYSSL
ncbi:hypothetical protein ACLOJK_032049 [Asimina triloba]